MGEDPSIGRRLRRPEVLVAIALVIGVSLRCAAFLANRSLWLDEAFLAVDLVERSFAELLEPLRYGHRVPVGFLLIERAFVVGFGTGELALRAFPLLCGIASLLLFWRLAARTLAPGAVPLAVALFALGEHLIYYSAELKQYSSDVLVTLLLLAVALPLPVARRRLAPLALLGVLAIWLSHPAPFVLAGIGLTAAWLAVRQRDLRGLAVLAPVGLAWGVSFAASFVHGLHDFQQARGILGEHRAYFMPLPPVGPGDWRWFVDTCFALLRNPVGARLPGVAALALGFGALLWWRERRALLAVLLAPVGLAILASGFQWYSISGRLMLFTTPALLLLTAAGAEAIRARAWPREPLLGVALLSLLLLHPILHAGYRLIAPRQVEETRPVLEHLRARHREGDSVYVYYAAEPAFLYYAPRLGLGDVAYIRGVEARDDWERYRADLARLEGRERVWLVFAHSREPRGTDEQRLLLSFLERRGRRLESVAATNASLHLYDLSPGAAGLPAVASAPSEPDP